MNAFFFSELGIWLGWTILVSMSTSWLLEKSDSHENGPRLLVVLFLKIHRVRGYDILCFEEEERTHINVARHSPWNHADVRLVRRKIHTRYGNLFVLNLMFFFRGLDAYETHVFFFFISKQFFYLNGSTVLAPTRVMEHSRGRSTT